MSVGVELAIRLLFFKQKTAYEIEYGHVGSEMCIRGGFETVDISGMGWRPSKWIKHIQEGFYRWT